MQLVTFRRGRGEPKLGAVWHECVLDLGGLYKDQATQRGHAEAGTRRLSPQPARADPGRRGDVGVGSRGLGVRQGPRRAAGDRRAGDAAAGLSAQAGAPARAHSLAGAQRLLSRPQLRGPCRRARRRRAGPSRVLHQAGHGGGGPRRRRRPPRDHQGARLRGRARGRDRHRRPGHPPGRGAPPRLRLHHHQRRDGARSAEAPQPVVQGQVARHLLPDGADARDGRRDPRSAGARRLASGQRSDAAVEPYRRR